MFNDPICRCISDNTLMIRYKNSKSTWHFGEVYHFLWRSCQWTYDI